MIELRMSAGDLTQLRFAYSPVNEALTSLNMLYIGQVYPLHRGWAAMARERLRTLDTTVLRAVVPAHRAIISAPLHTSGPATFDFQLKLLADWSPDLLRAELESVWRGHAMPEATRRIIADGVGGVRRVAAALGEYWEVALAPHWDQMRAVLDAEIAYRGRRVALGGVSALLEDLHPRLRLHQSAIRISKPRRGEVDLGGRGILLIPCVFAGVHIMVDPGGPGPATITYGPRGIGAVWEASDARQAGPDALSAMMGRGRAAILRAAGLPKSTSELSLELRLSGPTVSVHLATLRTCGLVTSWRSGRRVLYQRTPLAASLLAAAWPTPPADVTG